MDIRVEVKTIENIVYQYSDMIMRLAYQNVRNISDAEDILQDVFLALLKKQVFKDDRHLKAWLIRVTINKCKDYYRLQKNKIVPFEMLNNYLFNSEEESIIEELNQLPPMDRNIIYLYYFEGYNAIEIGKILKKSENAIFIRLSRAREKLKSILEIRDNG